MNTKFIKWKCEKASGFKYIEADVLAHGPEIHWRSGYKDWVQKCGLIGFEYSPLHPLLIRRAVEGINRECIYSDVKKLGIDIYTDCVSLFGESIAWSTISATSKQIDDAIDSALLYIYEQESK